MYIICALCVIHLYLSEYTIKYTLVEVIEFVGIQSAHFFIKLMLNPDNFQQNQEKFITIIYKEQKQMKRITFLATAMVLFIGMAATPVMAAEATASMDFVSAYVWRGQTFNDGMVAQPSIDVAAENGLGINVWGNYDIDDYNEAVKTGEFSEIDLTISYGKTFGDLDVGVGHIEYLFPGAEGEGSSEVYLSLAYPLPANLSVGFDIYYDYDVMEDYYTVLSLGYGTDLTKQLALEAGVTIAYAGEEYAGEDGDAGLYDYTLSASLGYAVTDAWGLSLYATYVGSLDDDNLVEKDDGGPLDTQFFGGVGISYAF